MRTSEFPLQTVKETPADAEIASHRLMLRAGMIRKLAAGLYTWLPLVLRVVRRVEAIVREEEEHVEETDEQDGFFQLDTADKHKHTQTKYFSAIRHIRLSAFPSKPRRINELIGNLQSRLV